MNSTSPAGPREAAPHQERRQCIDIEITRQLGNSYVAQPALGEDRGVVDDVVDDLGSRSAINYIRTILEHGTGADRQLAIFNETGNMEKVVDYITDETVRGL